MKVKVLEKKLRENGWKKTEGAKHSLWLKDDQKIAVPRHKTELKKGTALGILKKAGIKP